MTKLQSYQNPKNLMLKFGMINRLLARKFYLKNFKNEKKIPIYAAPHRAKNLTKLNPRY